MLHFADSAAREKRHRDEGEEPQLSPAEPCLADQVQLGCPEHVQLGSAEHVLLFRAVLEDIKVFRQAGNRLRATFKRKSPSWCKREAHQLAAANAQVDQSFAKARALSEGLQFGLLNPCVHNNQWQPASTLELLRVKTNKRFATTAINRSLASASGHSTPAMRSHAGGIM